jgi:bifunctional DNase/RNase
MPEPYGPLLYSRDNPARGPKAVVVLRRRRPPPAEAAAAAAAAAEAAAAQAAAAAAAQAQAEAEPTASRRHLHLEPRIGVPFFDPPDVDPPPGVADERDEARRRVRWQPSPPSSPSAAAAAPATSAAAPAPPPPLSPRPSAAHDFGLEYPDQAASFRQQQHQHQQPLVSSDDDPTLDEPADEEEQLALEVFISGDSAVQLYCLVNGAPSERPMALDLLWQVWRRAAAAEEKQNNRAAAAATTQHHHQPSSSSSSAPSTRSWGLVRAAIVELRAEVYIARLFFGDPSTGQVSWDADCRPSDACYLVLKTGAPMYVSRDVWRACAQRLRETEAFASIEHVRRVEEAQRAESEQRNNNAGGRGGAGAAGGPSSSSTARGATPSPPAPPGPDPDALPAVQLLKRELEVAVAEENYAAAAALRDHPLMRLAEDVRFYSGIGYADAAAELFDRLSAATEGGTRLVAAAVAEARLARAKGGGSGQGTATEEDEDEEEQRPRRERGGGGEA